MRMGDCACQLPPGTLPSTTPKAVSADGRDGTSAHHPRIFVNPPIHHKATSCQKIWCQEGHWGRWGEREE